MRWLFFTVILCGCGASPPPQLRARTFSDSPEYAVTKLDRVPPSVSSTPSPSSAGLETLGHHALQTVAIDTPNPLGATLGADLPFVPSLNQKRFAPERMVVRFGDQVIPYATAQNTVKKMGEGWKIHEGRLVIATRNHLPGEIVHIDTPSLLARAKSLRTLQTDHRFTYDDTTWSGMLLPNRATVTWALPLPPHAQFSAHIALQTLPLRRSVPRGASITLTVDCNDQPTLRLSRTLSRSEVPSHWTADLSACAGLPSRVSLTTDGEEGHQAVFVGSPEIVNAHPTEAPRRIVVIAVDTTRPDLMGFNGHPRDTSPSLDERVHTFTQFEPAWAPAPRTRPSFRTATTGRRPLPAVGAKTLGQWLDEAGFTTAGIVANVHLNPRFGFDRGFDRWALDTRATATQQVDDAIEWLHQQGPRDSFLFLHLMDPHLFYRAPKPYLNRLSKGVKTDLPDLFTRQKVLHWMQRGTLTPEKKVEIQRRHEAELAYTDAQINRFLAALDALQGPSLVVIHSDHGEEFWEHGGFEHNHTLYEELTRALLLVRPPAGAMPHTPIATTPVALMDIVPTVLDYANIDPTGPLDGQSLRPLIEGGTLAARPLDLGHLMYDRERWGVVSDGHKYILETASGAEQLFDLMADPAESSNLAPTRDTDKWLSALGEAHNAPTGPGWRIQWSTDSADIHLKLPRPAVAVAVMDPEARLKRRANRAWGETPKTSREDVARATLADRNSVLHIEPGVRPKGQVFVLFAKPTLPPKIPGLSIVAGPVILPPLGEADRMNGPAQNTGPEDEERALLKALGYLNETTE